MLRPITVPLVAVLALGCAAARPAPAARHASYPGSPEWREGHFENPPAWPRKPGVAGVLKWRLTPRAPRPGGFVAPYQPNDGRRLRQNDARFSATWIGHATVLLQMGGAAILTDPHFGDDTGGLFRRYAPPGVALRDLPPIDVVVISHNHRDHLDAESVDALGPRVHYVVPLGLAAWFRARGLTRVTELDWWQSATLTTARGKQVTVHLVPAQHWSQRALTDRNLSLWGGFVLDGGGKRVYFAGDTGYPAAFAEIGRRFPGIDLACLPIGAYEPRWFMHAQHMSPEQAAQAFRELRARNLLPIHWATFHLTDEPMDEPPRLLYRAMGALANRILFLPIGGSWFDGARPEAGGRGLATEQPRHVGGDGAVVAE